MGKEKLHVYKNPSFIGYVHAHVAYQEAEAIEGFVGMFEGTLRDDGMFVFALNGEKTLAWTPYDER